MCIPLFLYIPNQEEVKHADTLLALFLNAGAIIQFHYDYNKMCLCVKILHIFVSFVWLHALGMLIIHCLVIAI